MGTWSCEREALLRRLERLERQHRKTRRLLHALVALSLVGGVFVLFAPAFSPKLHAKEKRTVEAEAFILRDAQGVKRAALAMVRAEGDDGEPYPCLAFHDSEGNGRLDMSVKGGEQQGRGGPMLRLLDAGGHCKAILQAVGEIGAVLNLTAEGKRGGARLEVVEGVPRLWVGSEQCYGVLIPSQESVFLTLKDVSGGEVHLTTRAGGSQYLDLRPSATKKGSLGAVHLSASEKSAMLRLGIGDEKAWVQADATKETARLRVTGPKPGYSAMIVGGETRSSLSLHDSRDKVRADTVVSGRRAWVGLPDELGNSRASLSVFDGLARVLVFDELGKVRAVLGEALFPEPRTGETTRRAASSLILFDKKGKVLWSAPYRELPGKAFGKTRETRPRTPEKSVAPSPRSVAGASTFEPLLGGYIVAADGTYLGLISRSGLDRKSILNEIGPHGSDISRESIFNEIGRYGGDISSMSAFNDIASKPPRVYRKNGEFVAFLTTNTVKLPRIDPHALVGWLRSR